MTTQKMPRSESNSRIDLPATFATLQCYRVRVPANLRTIIHDPSDSEGVPAESDPCFNPSQSASANVTGVFKVDAKRA